MFRILKAAAVVTLVVSAPNAFAQSTPAAARSTPPARIASTDVIADMKAGLRNLITLQEAYWANHGSYTTDGVALGIYPGAKDQQSSVQVIFAGSLGWTGIARSRALPGKSCVLYVGNESDLPKLPTTRAAGTPATQEGLPACDAP